MSGKIIHLLNKRVTLEQPDGGFQTSIDAVLLAAACPAQAGGQSVLDLGCGVGAAGLCALQRIPDARLSGLEIQPREAALARNNAARNKRAFHVIEGDVRVWRTKTSEQRFDHVIFNPPYWEAGAHISSPDHARALAMGHVAAAGTTLEHWVLCALEALKPSGSLTLIHKAEALDEIIIALARRFGALEVIPLWPKQGRESKRVIVRAIKGRSTPIRLHSGLTLHTQNGDYTPQAEAILRDAAPL